MIFAAIYSVNFLLCLVLFFVPYLLPQTLSTKKGFHRYIVLCLCIAAYLVWNGINTPLEKHWDGMGALVGNALTYALALGMILGIFTRAMRFLFSDKKMHTAYYWILLILTPFLLWQALSNARHYRNRLPSTDCPYDSAAILLGNTAFKIPTFSIIDVIIDKEIAHPAKRQVSCMLHQIKTLENCAS